MLDLLLCDLLSYDLLMIRFFLMADLVSANYSQRH